MTASHEVKKDIRIPEGQTDLGFHWRLGNCDKLVLIGFTKDKRNLPVGGRESSSKTHLIGRMRRD
jgi:hypothetical protein